MQDPINARHPGERLMGAVLIAILLVVVLVGLFAVTRHSRRCADLGALKDIGVVQAQPVYDRECT